MKLSANDDCSPLKHPRRLLSLFLPIVAFIATSAYIIYWVHTEHIHAKHAHGAHEAVSLSIGSIARTMQTITRDLRYLSDDAVMRQMLDTPSEKNLTALATDWMSFSRNKQIYDKIRWIDEHGIERLRINYSHSKAHRTPPAELENKSKRYFFTDTLKLQAGEIFVSPLDLNVDKNELEVPLKPTIRLGMPLFDSKGEKRGILLINYLAIDMLSNYQKSFRLSSRKGWLLNKDGYWLIGGEKDDFGFMFGKVDANMAHRYPEAWKKIQSEEFGHFVTADGLWAFNTVTPLDEGQKTSTGSPSILAASASPVDSREYSWKTVYLMPMADYNRGLLTFAIKLGSGSLLLMLLFFIGIWHMIRAELHEKNTRQKLEKQVQSHTHALAELHEKLLDEDARLGSLIQALPELKNDP